MAIAQSVEQPRSGLKAAGSAIGTRMHLVRYAGFAVVAIVINLLSQNAVVVWLGQYWFGIYVAIAFGNASGLVFKFIADKYWVFDDVDPSLVANSKKFAMYAFFGVFTTLVFWAVELAFHYIFQSALMTNVGAVIGLCIGYVVKYNLDKHVTFAAARNAEAAAASAQTA
jgi:putative flippase GtrA